MRSGTLTKRLENEPLKDCYLLHYCVQREKCRLSSHMLSMITEFVYIRTGLYEFFTYSSYLCQCLRLVHVIDQETESTGQVSGHLFCR